MVISLASQKEKNLYNLRQITPTLLNGDVQKQENAIQFKPSENSAISKSKKTCFNNCGNLWLLRDDTRNFLILATLFVYNFKFRDFFRYISCNFFGYFFSYFFFISKRRLDLGLGLGLG